MSARKNENEYLRKRDDMTRNFGFLIAGIGLWALLLSVAPGELRAQKIGYIDSDEIIKLMPEYSGIEKRLNLLTTGWDEEVREMETEIEELQEEFDAREILFTEEVRKERLDEIEALKTQRDRFVEEKFGPDGEYFTIQAELLEPIQRQIFEALNVVAERGNYDLIFDRSGDTRYLYTNPDWNVTDRVLRELGIDEENIRN